MMRRPPRSTLFPSTPLSQSRIPFDRPRGRPGDGLRSDGRGRGVEPVQIDAWGYTRAGCLLAQRAADRSEEHTSELQSQSNLVCRLLLEKKNYSEHVALPRRI